MHNIFPETVLLCLTSYISSWKQTYLFISGLACERFSFEVSSGNERFFNTTMECRRMCASIVVASQVSHATIYGCWSFYDVRYCNLLSFRLSYFSLFCSIPNLSSSTPLIPSFYCHLFIDLPSCYSCDDGPLMITRSAFLNRARTIFLPT